MNDIRFQDNRWDLTLGISSLDSCQTWDLKSEQLSDFGSQGARIQDPRSKIFKKLFLDPGRKSWIRIQDPRSKIQDFQNNFLGSRAEIQDPRFERHALQLQLSKDMQNTFSVFWSRQKLAERSCTCNSFSPGMQTSKSAKANNPKIIPKVQK